MDGGRVGVEFPALVEVGVEVKKWVDSVEERF